MMPRGSDSSADRMVAVPARALLLGRDHTTRGTTVVLGAGRCAVGIARGWEPKPYAYVHPNEDAVAAVDGDDGHMLVVADGHHGFQASHEAVMAALELLGSPPRPADLRPRDIREIARMIAERVWTMLPGDAPSRTTLVVALRGPGHLQWFAAGDSALLVVDPRGPLRLPTLSRWFIGDDPSVAATRRGFRHGRMGLSPKATVVAATDGYTDYLPGHLPPADAAASAVRDAADAEHAVAALLEQAREGGAGDNVGVSVSLPW